LFLNKADRSSQSQQNHVSRLDNKIDKAKENTRLKVPADENSSNGTRISRVEESITSAISNKQEDVPEYNETRVPVVEERLSVNKVQSVIDLTITKEPVTETTSIEVPVTYEEITIQRRRRPVNKANAEEQTGEGPVQTNTEIKIPLMKEEIEISKQPYVKEEVIIRKKPVIETRTVTEEVKSEKVKVKRGNEDKEEKR
jgi:uncharacterized protein (TIGR02271 family)